MHSCQKRTILRHRFLLQKELRRDLIVRFLAELMQMTGSPDTQADFKAALQTYCDSLHPWLEPGDGPTQSTGRCSRSLNRCTFDETGENITVVLSPEAEALVRAWLRRNKIASDAGLNTAHEWSN